MGRPQEGFHQEFDKVCGLLSEVSALSLAVEAGLGNWAGWGGILPIEVVSWVIQEQTRPPGANFYDIGHRTTPMER